ncbi:autotransporter outer membrane beta-barrel domain-containing protein, partial [Escherichia coli]
LMMSLWDALRMNMMISYQELVRTFLKPYLNLAALNEFSDGNKVRLGDESVNASIDGAAFRVGAGVQADITKNMGAYASLDYTKGDDIENPLQGVVGINVTW